MSGFGSPPAPTNAPINYTGLNIGSSQWNAPIPIFWGMRRVSFNAIDYVNFTAKPANGKGKGGGGKGDQQQTYSATVLLAMCEGVVDSIQNIWANGSTTTTTTLAALNAIFFNGAADQAPWSYMTTNYPGRALAYSQTAYVGAINLGLGESATIPDLGMECVRTNGFAYTWQQEAGGWINPSSHAQCPAVDCLMSDIITDLLTNVQYGFDFTSDDFGSMTQYATYQRAQGIFFSPLLVAQEKCTEILDRWAQLSNSWIYDSGTQLEFVPLGDSEITANGVTYTPVQDIAYNLTPCDFLQPDGKDGGIVKVTRIDPADAFYRTALDFTDRTLGYIDNPVQFRDDGLINQYGLRDNSSIEADEICDPTVADIVVQLLGKRNAYIRNSYTFNTSYKYILCLPGAILTLTDPTIPLNQVRVRVKTVARSGKNKDGKGVLAFTCEEFPGNIGTYYPPIAAPAVTTATTPVINIAPGAVNTPAIVEPDSAFTGGTPKIIIAASGGENWGGCTVNISFDGDSYSQIGTINAPAKQGVLDAALAAYSGANPDTINTLDVDCAESLTSPTPVTEADATALRTLSLVASQPTLVDDAYVMPTNGELLAFGEVTATTTYGADLTYLVRGAYGTSPGAHSIGDQFTLLDVTGTDGTSVAYDLPAEYIGQTLYLKLASFNVFGQAQQDLSTVAEYQYTPSGAGYGAGATGAPLTPTGFALVGSPGPNGAAFAWNANAPTDNVTSYTLWRAPGLGAAFSAAAAIWSGQTLGDADVSAASSTAYSYFLTANNAVGASANTAGVNATTTSAPGTSTQRLTIASATTALGAPLSLTWYVDINNTYAGPITIKLPASPVVGQIVAIADETGNAGSNGFTIETSAGAALTPAATVGVNYGSFTARWNGAYWLQVGG